MSVSPEYISFPNVMVIGTQIRTDTEAESSIEDGKIVALWEDFFNRNLLTKIPNKCQGGPIMGVFSGYSKGKDGRYNLLAGSKVLSLDSVPEGMVSIHVPSGNYLKFQSPSAAPSDMIRCWQEIWRYFSGKTNHKRAFTYDLELYRSETDIDILVAVH